MSKDPKKDSAIKQFRNVTSASAADAVKFLKKYSYRVDAAVDGYFNDVPSIATTTSQATRGPDITTKLGQLFDKYKDPNDDNITVDGTMKLCEDLGVELEDVVLLAVAYELKSPGVAEWTKKGWVDGWKALRCDSIESMRAYLPRLRTRLSSEPDYFRSVYVFTFDFARTEGQRSLAVDSAIAFWQLLLPIGLSGRALAHIDSGDGNSGWESKYNDWWFEYLNEKGGKGISKDTWHMFVDFVRQIDSKFEKHDLEAAWPSTIDDFVDWAREKSSAKET